MTESKFISRLKRTSFRHGVFVSACILSIIQDVMNVLDIPPYDSGVTMLQDWVPAVVSGPIATVLIVVVMVRHARLRPERGDFRP